jgi:hydrogenase nickel incorporation protein HypA/HybF
MHELSVCQALLAEVECVADSNGGGRVSEIRLAIGPLSGVEPALLERAFTIARAGTCAADARLTISAMPVTVRCRNCGAGGEATANRLLCPECGDWRVDLASGDELQLTEVTLECDEPVLS